MEFLTQDWKCFFKVAETKSASRAAQALHLPQSSVSKYIKRLEEELQTQLFLRGNRGVRLTESGEALYARMHRAQFEFEDQLRKALHTQEVAAGPISLGAHRSVGLNYFPRLISSLAHSAPRIHLDLHFAPSQQLCRMVSLSEVDYALVANALPMDGLVIRKCFTESVGLFSARKTSLRDLKRIYYNPEMQQLPRILRKLRGIALIPIADYEILGSTACAEAGNKNTPSNTAAILPRIVAIRHGLKAQVMPEAFYTATIALIYRSEIQKSAKHRALLQSLKLNFEKNS